MIGNQQQNEAIMSNSPLILTLAGAGTGKSFTLVNRILRLVNEGVDPRAILALTFTNAAAFEMKERFKKLANSTILPEFRTFHGFCYSLLIKDKEVRDRLGYSKVPEIGDERKIQALRSKAKMQLGISMSDDKLSSRKGLSQKEKEQADTFDKLLAKMIRAENVITFDMLCYNVCALFEKDDACIYKYKNRYKHILVDEFQDTDPKQFKFLSSFPSSTNFFLVGDALQCIYKFRGCSNEYIKVLSSAPEWNVIKLYKNYRSTEQICNFANKMSTYAKDEYRIEMEGQRSGDEVELIFGSNTSFNEPVDRYHLRLLVDKLSSTKSDSAVLCRTNKEVKAVCDELTRNKIPHTTSTKNDDTGNILNSIFNDEYLLEWLASMLDSKNYADYIRTEQNVSLFSDKLNRFIEAFSSDKQISSAVKKVTKIRTILNNTAYDNKSKIDKIADSLKVKIAIDGVDNCDGWDNATIISHIISSLSLEDSYMIYVGTIHSSKGLEYDSVYLMGVDDGMFELGTEDMNNLYYVGITRARDHLTVFRR